VWLPVCDWLRMIRRLAPLAGVLAVSILLGGALVAATRQPPGDPVADMNHAVHIERDLTCPDCHTGVEKEARAGVPSILICVDCHEGDAADNLGGGANGALIADHIARKEELWWPALYELPKHVLFSHRRHVVLGGIGCEKCHGEMGKRTTLPTEPNATVLTMEGCMACHAASEATRDCWACHK